MRYQKIFVVTSFFLLFSCSETNGKLEQELLNSSPCKVSITSTSLLLKDSEACFKIAPIAKSYKIISAYVGCGMKTSREFDIVNQKIKNCSRALQVEDDSVMIYFEPNQVGKFKFEDVTLLLQDDKNKFYFIDTTFYYNVIETVK